MTPELTIAERTAQAGRLGAEAFARGAKAVPAHDPALMPLLSGLKVGQGLPVLTAWTKAWHAANLAAPIEGES